MAQSINLIPQEERTAQVKVQFVRLSTVIAILLLVVVGSISGYFYYKVNGLRADVKTSLDNITKLRSDIQSLADIEVIARNLDKRYTALRSILDERPYYSVLLSELQKRVPSSVNVDDLNLRQSGTMGLAGLGDNYISISEFLSNLTDPSESLATEGLDELFTKVSLKSVNLDNKTSGANYAITVDFDQGVLAK